MKTATNLTICFLCMIALCSSAAAADKASDELLTKIGTSRGIDALLDLPDGEAAGVVDLNKLFLLSHGEAGGAASILCPGNAKVVGGGGGCGSGGRFGSSIPSSGGHSWIVTCARIDPRTPVATTRVFAMCLRP